MGQKILIVKPTALGDVAQACLVVPAIKELQPDCKLSWVVDEQYADVVKICPAIDEVIEFPRERWRKKLNFTEIKNWAKELREKNFDVALDLQGLARSGWITWETRAPRRIGLKSAREFSWLAYTERVADRETHAVERYRQGVERLLGRTTFGKHFYLQPPELPENFGLVDGSYTVLHPYSSWETKLWPWERYEQLAESLPEEKFVLVGNGAFFPVAAPNMVDLRNRTSLKELLAVLGHSKIVISTDSGPAHLAAALGRNVISLFGATDPHKTAPKPKSGKILTSMAPCRPCLKRICRFTNPMQCLSDISMENAREAWKEMTL